MLRIPIKMPKACRECPFFMPDTAIGGEFGNFHCGLIFNLQVVGGYDEKYHNSIMRLDYAIKNRFKLNKNCLLVKFNKQKAR